MYLRTFLCLTLTLVLLGACASKKITGNSDGPDWTRGPTRTVDNGYIVYVGVGEDTTLERATFKAESMAIADLANECSLAPKGARFEDRFSSPVNRTFWAYAKLGVTFDECEEAKRAVQPDDVRRLANVQLTEQLKRYQDTYYEPGTPEQTQETGSQTVAQNDSQYYAQRQQVAAFKEVVILAPPAAYPVYAPQTVQYVNAVQAPMERVRTYEVSNPTVRTTPSSWSTVQATSTSLPSSAPRLRESGVPSTMRSAGGTNPRQNFEPQAPSHNRGSYQPRRRKRNHW